MYKLQCQYRTNALVKVMFYSGKNICSQHVKSFNMALNSVSNKIYWIEQNVSNWPNSFSVNKTKLQSECGVFSVSRLSSSLQSKRPAGTKKL